MRISSYVLIALSALALSVTPAYGDTLTNLWRRMASEHPKVKGATARLALVRAREAQAKANFYPRIGVQYDFARSKNESLRVFEPQDTTQGDAFLRLNVFNGFADIARKRSANKEVRATQEDLADSKEDLALALTELYVTVVTLEQQERNAHNLVDDLLLLVDTVRSAVGIGRNPESDMIQATTKLLEARANLSDVQGRLAGARGRLAAMVGAPIGALVDPHFYETVANQPLSDLMNTARERTPEWRAARLRADQAGDEVRVAKGELYPKIGFEGRKNIERHGPAELVSGLERESLFSITYEFSLGRTPYRRVDEARERELAARAMVEEIERELEGQIAETRETLLEFMNLAPQLLDRQRAAVGVHDAYRWQFNAGRRSLLDLITVRQDQYFSVEAVIANLRNRWFGTARLQRLLGQLHGYLEDPSYKPASPSLPGRAAPEPPADLPLKLDRTLPRG